MIWSRGECIRRTWKHACQENLANKCTELSSTVPYSLIMWLFSFYILLCTGPRHRTRCVNISANSSDNANTLTVHVVEGALFITVSCLHLWTNSTALNIEISRFPTMTTSFKDENKVWPDTVKRQFWSNDMYCECESKIWSHSGEVRLSHAKMFHTSQRFYDVTFSQICSGNIASCGGHTELQC